MRVQEVVSDWDTRRGDKTRRNVNNPPLCLDTANRRLIPPIDQVQASEQSSGLAVSIADQTVLRGNRTSKRPAQEIRKQRTMAKERTMNLAEKSVTTQRKKEGNVQFTSYSYDGPRLRTPLSMSLCCVKHNSDIYT